MTQTVADYVIVRLHLWGVRRMFGYPGDGINDVFGALNRAGNTIEFIQARHEEMAAFMAFAYANPNARNPARHAQPICPGASFLWPA